MFGWLLYLILSTIVLKSVIDTYIYESEIEWIPLACIVGLGIAGGLFQFLPDKNVGKGSSGGNTIIPPTDNSSSSDGGF